jgi:hypothetical protein
LTPVQSSLDRIRDLVAKFLRYAKPDLNASHAPRSINELSTTVQSMLKDPFEKMDILIRTELEGLLPDVLIDYASMEQVFINILTNAKQALLETPNWAKKIVINTSKVKLDEQASSILNISPGNYVEVKISDNAQGIPADVLPKIFQPLFTTKGRIQSTGMGLATSQSIVQALGGSIAAKSEVGKGTTFSIYLPEYEKPEAPLFDSSAVIYGQGQRIMVLDPDPMLGELELQRLNILAYSPELYTEIDETLFKQLDQFEAIVIRQKNGNDVSHIIEKILVAQKDKKIILVSDKPPLLESPNLVWIERKKQSSKEYMWLFSQTLNDLLGMK